MSWLKQVNSLKGGDVQGYKVPLEGFFTPEEKTLLQGLTSIGGTRKIQIC